MGTNGDHACMPLTCKTYQLKSTKKITLPIYMVMLACFNKTLGQLEFKHDHGDWKWTALDSKISMVTMSFIPKKFIFR